MAWNEPGGGSRDPWGNRSDKGPPDLDEVLRNLQNKLGAIFGKRAGSGGQGKPTGPAKMGSFGIGLIGVIVTLIWLGSGIFIVQPAERGVVTQFGRYSRSAGPGPHWHIPWPIQAVQKVNVDQNRTVRLRSQPMLTQDENIVEIDLAVQYNVKDAPDFLFNVRNPDLTLQEVSESAIREVIGKNDLDFIVTQGRDEVASRTQELLQETLDQYQSGLLVQTVNLQDAQPPEAVQAAFADAIKAREDEQRYINQAEAYSNGIIPVARGDAKRRLEEAKGYRVRVVKSAEGEASRFAQLLAEYEKAPQVTRDRLYLEAVEAVLSTTNKVVVDVEGGNNIMYLPLDKLVRREASSGPPVPATSPGISEEGREVGSGRRLRGGR